jgi:hypothetical protein
MASSDYRLRHKFLELLAARADESDYDLAIEPSYNVGQLCLLTHHMPEIISVQLAVLVHDGNVNEKLGQYVIVYPNDKAALGSARYLRDGIQARSSALSLIFSAIALTISIMVAAKGC